MAWQNYSYPLNYFHVLMFIIAILFLAITEIFYQWKMCNNRIRVGKIVILFIDSATLIYSFLEETANSLKKWNKIYQRIFLCSIIMYFMLLTSVFKGNIVKDMSNSLISEDPKHACDILQSNKPVIYFNSMHTIYRKYANDTDLMMSKLMKRRSNCGGWGRCLLTIIDNDEIMIIRDNYAYNARAQYWDNRTGADLFHIVPEMPFVFFSAMTVPKGSPYQKKLNEMILLCTEAGIINHGILTAKHSLELKRLRRYILGQFIPEESHKPINLKNIDMVISVFLIMLFISTFAFLCEIIIGNYFLKRG